MKRESKYGTNKTIRFCQKSLATWLQYSSSQQLSVDKNYRWKLLDILKERSKSSDYDHKIVVRRNYNFRQYNGYRSELRAHPPRHVSFPRRPDFVYQPYVNFVGVRSDTLEAMLQHGWRSSHNEDDLPDLFDVDGEEISVTLVYFLDGLVTGYWADWDQACQHAFGGSFAGYYSFCMGDYCPFGPTIRGQLELDSRINQVLLIFAPNDQRRRHVEYTWRKRSYSRKSERLEYKDYRGHVKSQRRSEQMLTKEARTGKNDF